MFKYSIHTENTQSPPPPTIVYSYGCRFKGVFLRAYHVAIWTDNTRRFIVKNSRRCVFFRLFIHSRHLLCIVASFTLHFSHLLR